VPGDDLRFLDRRASMRHGKLLVREFETETERGLRLLIDASRSMAYRSESAPGAKLSFAALIGAALSHVVLSGYDTVSLDWLGSDENPPLSAMGGMEAFERLLDVLEAVRPGGDVAGNPSALEKACERVAQRSRRGAVIAVLSDFLDLPEGAEDRLAALASGGRVVVAVRILDPAEATFPFEGPIRLKASEGDRYVETDAGAARRGYLSALAAQMTRYKDKLASHGARFVEAVTSDDPVDLVQGILATLDGETA
jgi:uncharacterized protein (DUF58 family)